MIISRGWRLYGLGILALTVFLNAYDQVVIAAVAPLIQAEFKLSDAQLGSLFGAFVVALALGAPLLGFLADRASRRTIIAAGLAAWSVATAAGGVAAGFTQLLVARAAVGVGEASSQPAGVSLLGDYFAARHRGRAMATVIAAAGLGTGGGLILGGITGHQLGWRAAFFVAGLPGLAVALLALTIREPRRGAAEERRPSVAAVAAVPRLDYRALLRNRTYLAILLAGTLGLFSQGSSQLLNVYLGRRFGLDVQQASALVGSPLLAGAVVGTPLFGWLMDWLGRRREAGAVEVAFAATLLAAAAAVMMFTASSVTAFAAGAAVFGFVQWAFVLMPFVVIQNVIDPPLRAGATAATVLAGRLFGSALGPFLVGLLSDQLGGNLGRSLLILVPASLLLSAATLGWAWRWAGADRTAMVERWAAEPTAGAQAA